MKRRALSRPLREFMETESSSGMVMIAFAVLALLAANSGLSGWYYSFIDLPIRLGFGEGGEVAPLKEWVKDILMVFFFLLIGLELKREMKEGFLARKDQVFLPLLCAAGGMIAPAIIFLALNRHSPETLTGWAIPSATDIAFALAVLSLVGKGIPPSIKVFLLAIAIFDDLGAILIIAGFYNAGIALPPLLLALAGVGALWMLNRKPVTSLAPYMLVGVYLWFCLHHAGLHTTLAGVLVGIAIPMRNPKQSGHSPLDDCIHRLHPWVSFLVLPLFAFTAAGVSFQGMDRAVLSQSLPLGIALGLFFGKQIGIFGMAWGLIKLRFVTMPEGARFSQIYAVSILAGIGFTMSLFIGMLAFTDPALQDGVKTGVIAGSLLSVLWGGAVVRWVGR